MPRIETLRLFGPLWCAFSMNDRGEKGKPCFGLSERAARTRVMNHEFLD